MACRREKPNGAALRKNALRLCLSGVLLGLGWAVLFEAYEYAPMSTVTPRLDGRRTALLLVLGERLSALSALGAALVLFSMAISETGPGIAAFFSKSCKKQEG